MEADEEPCNIIKLLDRRYDSNLTVSRISVQTELFSMACSGQNIEYVVLHR